MHTRPSCLVSFQYCGVLNEEHSGSVLGWSNSFLQEVLMSLALNELIQISLHSNSNTASDMHHKWKEIIDFVCITITGKSRDQLPTKSIV